jgi:hypothetical protein
MRKVALLTAGSLVLGGLLLAAAPAGAATARGQGSKFCQAFGDSDIPTDGTEFDEEFAEETADSLRRAAKHAPKKVKKAMRRVAKAYDDIDSEEEAIEAFTDEDLIEDSITYSTYYLEECANIEVPEP